MVAEKKATWAEKGLKRRRTGENFMIQQLDSVADPKLHINLEKRAEIKTKPKKTDNVIRLSEMERKLAEAERKCLDLTREKRERDSYVNHMQGRLTVSNFFYIDILLLIGAG